MKSKHMFIFAHSLCVQALRSSVLAELLHGTRPVGVTQALPPDSSLTDGATDNWLGGH